MPRIDEVLKSAERAAREVLAANNVQVEALALHVVGLDRADGGRFRYAYAYAPNRLWLLGKPEGELVAARLAHSLAETAADLRPAEPEPES